MIDHYSLRKVVAKSQHIGLTIFYCDKCDFIVVKRLHIENLVEGKYLTRLYKLVSHLSWLIAQLLYQYLASAAEFLTANAALSFIDSRLRFKIYVNVHQ